MVIDAAPGLVAADAADGFAQPALHASPLLLRDKARQQGIAAVAIRDSHHFAALWPDIEPPSVGSRLQRPVECGDRLGETDQRLLAGASESVGAAADAVEPAVDVAV